MHVRENSLTTNTARLMEKLLTHSRILLRGSSTEGPLTWSEPENWPVSGAETGEPVRPEILFLFPSEDARDLSEVLPELKGRPVHLVVPDGNWKQGAKTKRRIPEFHSVTTVKLPEGAMSEYRLRKEPRPECLSTFEAISRALGVIEGAEVSDDLMTFFRMKQDRVLYARGLKKAGDVCGGIPLSGLKPWH
jgi:DTW domain-containing protein